MTQYSSNYYFELIHDQICYKLTFMDTPGLGDSRGLDQDDKNITNILDTISKTPELNAIVVMVNGSDPRGNTRIKYIITRLMGILPNAVQNNIVVLLSNVATEPNLNMQKLMIDLGMPKLSNENVFYFDNPIFSIDFSKYNTKQLEKYDNIFLELEDKLAQFLQHTSQKRMEKTTEFRQIKEKRDLLKDQMAIIKINIKDLQEEKEKTENFISELESLKDLKKAKELIKIGKQSQSTYEQIPTPYHNTRCQQCNSNCHENCGLEETTNTGSLSFLQCLAFKKNVICNICHHHYNYHVHLRSLWKPVQKVIDILKPEVLADIERICGDEKRKTNLINELKTKIDNLEKEINSKKFEIKLICENLKIICSNFNYRQEVEYIVKMAEEEEQVIEADISKNKTKEKEKELILIKKLIKVFKDVIRYMFS